MLWTVTADIEDADDFVLTYEVLVVASSPRQAMALAGRAMKERYAESFRGYAINPRIRNFEVRGAYLPDEGVLSVEPYD